MTYEEIKNIMDLGEENVVWKQFCVFPNQIATYIEKVAGGSLQYGYVLIGVTKEQEDYQLYGISKHINMDSIIRSALKQVRINTEVSWQMSNLSGKTVCIIKVKTCDKVIPITSTDIIKMNEVLREVLSACVKLQANSIFYNASEDQRNDFIRDLLDTAGYDVKDQTRRGLSQNGKSAGEIDILIKEQGFPVTIIEALNLSSLNKSYLDDHIDKIFGYDTAGNKFNIILSYVTVSDFWGFCDKYYQHVEKYDYPFDMISIEKDIIVDSISYSDIQIMKTILNRNGKETALYHVCVGIK